MSEFLDQQKRVKPKDEQADFVLNFVQDSREEKDEIESIWDEVDDNFLVRPFSDISLSGDTSNPLSTNLSETITPRLRDQSILKDPETHQSVMTIVSKIALALFPRVGFVGAKGVGFEDAFKGTTVKKLIEHAHRLPNQYITFIEWLLSAGIRGTGIIRGFWHYQEELRTLREVGIDLLGQPIDSATMQMVPVWDDPRFQCVDVRNFFPDPGKNDLFSMAGAAEQGKMTAAEALRMVERGLFDEGAVRDAIDNRVNETPDETQDIPTDDPTALSHRQENAAPFATLAYTEYYGETPFKSDSNEAGPEDGISRRVITEMGGRTVRTRPWPRRLPFFKCGLTPRLNSFWDISPAEVIRFDQDFADTLKMMLADAVVRMTHPPLIYNKYAEVDLAKLHSFKPDVPIGADMRQGPAVDTVKYDPALQPAFAMYSGIKGQMREASAALGATQGLGLGSKRFSASEAVQTFDQALERPEFFAQVIEREYLPPIGKFTLELYQEFLSSDDETEIGKRIGETEFPIPLATILADYDIEFIGSRVEQSKGQRLQNFREIFQAAANPIVAQLIPWIPFLRKYFDELGEQELAAMVANPQMVALNVELNTIGQGNDQTGNGAEQPAQEPLGLLQAQRQGSELT